MTRQTNRPHDDGNIVFKSKGVTDEKEGLYVDELMSTLVTKLSRVCETIMVTHKSYIVNLKHVTKKVNDTNNYLIYTNAFPDKRLVVGQNHKKRFNELIATHNIALESA